MLTKEYFATSSSPERLAISALSDWYAAGRVTAISTIGHAATQIRRLKNMPISFNLVLGRIPRLDRPAQQHSGQEELQ